MTRLLIITVSSRSSLLTATTCMCNRAFIAIALSYGLLLIALVQVRQSKKYPKYYSLNITLGLSVVSLHTNSV